MEIKGLTEFQRDLLKTSTTAPKEMPKILRKIGNKARTVVARKARRDVKKLTGNYHKSWKRGKVFKGYDGALTVRVINSSPHAHLIEDGHRQVVNPIDPNTGKRLQGKGIGEEVGFVPGKKVLDKGMREFDDSRVADEMLGDWLDDLLRKNKL